MYAIDKDITMPTKHERLGKNCKKWDFIGEMKTGDSILVPNASAAQKVIYHMKRRATPSQHYITRRVYNGIRIWRTTKRKAVGTNSAVVNQQMHQQSSKMIIDALNRDMTLETIHPHKQQHWVTG